MILIKPTKAIPTQFQVERLDDGRIFTLIQLPDGSTKIKWFATLSEIARYYFLQGQLARDRDFQREAPHIPTPPEPNHSHYGP